MCVVCLFMGVEEYFGRFKKAVAWYAENGNDGKAYTVHVKFFLVACTRLYNLLCRSVRRSHCFFCITAPAQMNGKPFLSHLHATSVAVYTALFLSQTTSS